MRKTRRRHVVGKPGGRVVFVHERGVIRQRQRALFGQIGNHRIAPARAVALQHGIAGMHRFHLHRDIVFELGAIGDMQVHIHQRIPLLHQPQHRLHFRCVGLEVVAIEIEVLRGGAPAHLFGATLIGAVPGAEALVAVDVEHRHKYPHQFVEHALAGLAVQQLAQRQKARILAVDLAGMDAALHQHHRQLALRGTGRIQRAACGNDQRLHRPAFRVVPNSMQRNRLRIALREGIAQRDDFIVASGLRRCARPG